MRINKLMLLVFMLVCCIYAAAFAAEPENDLDVVFENLELPTIAKGATKEEIVEYMEKSFPDYERYTDTESGDIPDNVVDYVFAPDGDFSYEMMFLLDRDSYKYLFVSVFDNKGNTSAQDFILAAEKKYFGDEFILSEENEMLAKDTFNDIFGGDNGIQVFSAGMTDDYTLLMGAYDASKEPEFPAAIMMIFSVTDK